MNNILHVLNAAHDLDPFLTTINNSFNSTITKITAKIPVDNVDVVVAHNPAGAIPEIGIGGRALNPHLVFISVDAHSPKLGDLLPERLERTLAHELHHCARWSAVGYGKTLLEALITEGLADHFVVEVTGKEPNPWSTALSQDQIRTYLERATAEFSSETYNHQAWFFGRGKTDLPKWTGYALGFYLVGEYLKKHPDEKFSGLFGIRAEEFI